MGTGLQIDIEGRFLQQGGLFDGCQGIHLGMRLSVAVMVALSDNSIAVYNHGAHHRVGLHPAQP